MKKPEKKIYKNREISWLSFNDRVLQEAGDKDVPLLERIKFLGIFSSNLDEFFRIRVATLKRIVKLGSKAEKIIGDDPKDVLNKIQETVLVQQEKFENVYRQILEELGEQKIFLINEKDLNKQQAAFVKDYFDNEVRPRLIPIMIDAVPEFPYLKDKSIYLAIKLIKKSEVNKPKYALIEVPSDLLPRFIKLPKIGDKNYLILLEDVIRFSLNEIFSIFDFDIYEAYTVKLTRDAELDIDNDAFMSYIEKITKSLQKRQKGTPVRFIYDENISQDLLKYITKRMNFKNNDNLIPGGRYHNFKDFINFPSFNLPHLQNEKYPPLEHPEIAEGSSLISIIAKKDLILHYPYQSFHYLIDLLREAAIDPKVESIKMTLYRVAKNSSVVNALINAVKNGKQVTVVMELQARFDEEANIYWSRKLEEEGVRVINGVPNYKVHAKLCLIERREKGKSVLYGSVGTGNFNESTAKIYADENLFTSDKRITEEIEKVFDFFQDNTKIGHYKHLLLAPHFMRNKLEKMIENEIRNAENGKPAYIILKLNALVDNKIIDKLYRANQVGVKVKLIIRGICSLIPGIKGISENIAVISIVDKYLEHARLFIFCNDGKEKIYLSSGDWMTRNLANRIEVACPIYDVRIQKELKNMLFIQLNDNVKARVLNDKQDNQYRKNKIKSKVRAQIEIYKFLKSGTMNKEIDLNLK